MLLFKFSLLQKSCSLKKTQSEATFGAQAAVNPSDLLHFSQELASSSREVRKRKINPAVAQIVQPKRSRGRPCKNTSYYEKKVLVHPSKVTKNNKSSKEYRDRKRHNKKAEMDEVSKLDKINKKLNKKWSKNNQIIEHLQSFLMNLNA